MRKELIVRGYYEDNTFNEEFRVTEELQPYDLYHLAPEMFKALTLALNELKRIDVSFYSQCISVSKDVIGQAELVLNAVKGIPTIDSNRDTKSR